MTNMQDRLEHSRFFASFDQDGRMKLTELEPDAFIATPRELVKIVQELPVSTTTVEILVELAEVITDKLAGNIRHKAGIRRNQPLIDQAEKLFLSGPVMTDDLRLLGVKNPTATINDLRRKGYDIGSETNGKCLKYVFRGTREAA